MSGYVITIPQAFRGAQNGKLPSDIRSPPSHITSDMENLYQHDVNESLL
tara:strand:+ start:6715 stop:6861 length:147 start_codon:yes stop_codon:yes gene_type:complete